MGADEDDLAGEVGPGDLGDDVGDGDVFADAVGEGEGDGDGTGFGVAVEEAFEEGDVFGADLGFGDGIDGAGEIEGDEGFGAVGAAGGEDGGGGEGAKAIEAREELLQGGLLAEALVLEEGDGAFDLRGEAVEGAGGEGGDVEDVAADAGGGGGGAPADGVEVEGVVDGGEDMAGGGLRLPGGGDGPDLGVDVGEAELLEVLLSPVGSAHVVGGAGEAGADGVGELAVVLIGLSVEEDVADEVADGGAGLGCDGGGSGLRGLGASGSGGEGKEDEGGKELTGCAGDGGHAFRYTEVCGLKSPREGLRLAGSDSVADMFVRTALWPV